LVGKLRHVMALTEQSLMIIHSRDLATTKV